MITAGIIAEYNPFHRGHRYHIEETRKKTGADYVIAVMSGNYVQRGEPAVADKYFRAGLALKGGADIVLELPVYYATASAEYFAMAGVTLIHKLHCVDYLSFGSEWATIEEYEPLADFLLAEPSEYQCLLRQLLKDGKNYPKARLEAVSQLYDGMDKGKICELLRHPNHILGLEYIKGIKRLGSLVQPVAIRRRGSGYHEESMENDFPSASAIRKVLMEYTEEKRSTLENVLLQMQDAVGEGAEELKSSCLRGNIVTWKDFMPYLDYICLMQPEEMEKCFGVGKELASRLSREYRFGESIEGIVEKCHGKNMTDTALLRACLHIVLQLKNMPYLEQASHVPVPYARVLGFKKKAAPLLKKMREEGELYLIQRPAEGRKLLMEESPARSLFMADIRTSDFYEQILAKKSGREPLIEWKRQQIII